MPSHIPFLVCCCSFWFLIEMCAQRLWSRATPWLVEIEWVKATCNIWRRTYWRWFWTTRWIRQTIHSFPTNLIMYLFICLLCQLKKIRYQNLYVWFLFVAHMELFIVQCKNCFATTWLDKLSQCNPLLDHVFQIVFVDVW
jgi:hypothetical protein